MSERVDQVIGWMEELTNATVDFVDKCQEEGSKDATAVARKLREVAHRIAEYVHGGYVDPARVDRVIPDLQGAPDEAYKGDQSEQ